MNILNLMSSAGMFNMLIMTALLVLVITWIFRCYMLKHKNNHHGFESHIEHLCSLGLFAFMMGLLLQLIGIYVAFQMFEQLEGAVAPTIF